MNSKPKNKKEFRLKVIHYALEKNISEASSLFGLNRATISRWIKNYKTEGENSLSNKSRVRQKHPCNKITSELEKEIIGLKINEPHITIKEIISRLNLNCSQTIVSRCLKNNGLSAYKAKSTESGKDQNSKTKIKEFDHNWEITCNYVTTKYIDRKKRLLYRIVLKERSSGIQFAGFTYEKSNLSISIFVDYILHNLRTTGYKIDNMVINAPNSSVYTNIKGGNDTFLGNLLNIKYKAKLAVNAPSKSIIRFDSGDTLETYDIEDINTSSDLIKYSFMNILHKNLDIISKGLSYGKQNLQLLFVPPIIVDDFIHDINAIKNFDHYWHSLNRPEVRDRIVKDVLNGLKLIGDLTKNKYENQKALDLYDRIISTIQYTQTDNKKLKMSVHYKKGEIFQLTGDYSNAIRQLGYSLELAEDINDYDTIADSSYLLGDLFKITQSDPEYRKYYDKALSVTKHNGNEKEDGANDLKKIKYYKTLGIILSRQLNFVLALNNFNIMLEEAKKQNDRLNYSTALQLIGETYKNLSLFTEALEYIEKRVEIELDINDKFRLMELYNSLAALNYELENFDKALKYYNTQLELAKEIGDKGSEAVAYKKIADIHFNIRHENKAAVTGYLNALNLFDEIDDKVNKFLTMILLSIVYKKTQNYRKAVSILNKVKAASNEIGNHYILSCVEGQLGSICLYQNRPDRALDCFLIQENIARMYNFNSLLANASKFISRIYLYQKKYARSDIFDKEANKIYSMLNQRYGENELIKDFIHQAEDYQYLLENYK